MGFPKVPRTAIIGQLKLTVRPKELEFVVGEPEEDITSSPDLASSLNVKLPRGFQLETSPTDVTLRQQQLTLDKVNGIRKKRTTCAACKRATSEAMLDAAEQTTNAIVGTVLPLMEPLKVDFRQDKTGTLELHYEIKNKTIGIRIHTGAVELGFYLNGTLVTEERYKLMHYQVSKSTRWLRG